jgi:hypothetical protein
VLQVAVSAARPFVVADVADVADVAGRVAGEILPAGAGQREVAVDARGIRCGEGVTHLS